MDITNLIDADRVITSLRVSDKQQLLTELARRAARRLGIDTQAILGALVAREELGSTGLGQGIAIPHARIDSLNSFFGLFARLERPIDFAAVDERPVDLVFLLLMPADAGNAHLAALSSISRRLRDRAVAERLRVADEPAALYEILAGTQRRPVYESLSQKASL